MPKLDLNSLHQRGILLIALRLFFVIMFLVGGGVVGSTDGGYWTGIFFLAFFGGLVGIGPFVYRSAKATLRAPQPQPQQKLPLKFHFLNTMVIMLMIPLSQVFFRSELFRSRCHAPVHHRHGAVTLHVIRLGAGFYARTRRASKIHAVK